MKRMSDKLEKVAVDRRKLRMSKRLLGIANRLSFRKPAKWMYNLWSSLDTRSGISGKQTKGRSLRSWQIRDYVWKPARQADEDACGAWQTDCLSGSLQNGCMICEAVWIHGVGYLTGRQIEKPVGPGKPAVFQETCKTGIVSDRQKTGQGNVVCWIRPEEACEPDKSAAISEGQPGRQIEKPAGQKNLFFKKKKIRISRRRYPDPTWRAYYAEARKRKYKREEILSIKNPECSQGSESIRGSLSERTEIHRKKNGCLCQEKSRNVSRHSKARQFRQKQLHTHKEGEVFFLTIRILYRIFSYESIEE